MPEVQVLSNPRKRPAKRRTTKSRKAPARKRNPTRRTASRRTPARATRRTPTRRRRRNPVRRQGIVNQNVMPALRGAAGAIVLDGAYSMLPIPEQYQTGYTGALVKAGTVLGIGYMAKQAKLLKPATITELVNGSLTVQMHAIGQELVGGMVGGGVTTTPNGSGSGSGGNTTQGLGYAGSSPRAGTASPLAGYEGLSAMDADYGMAGYEMLG